MNMQAAEDLFSRLNDDNRALLMALPYRVGLYVSFSDVTGGWTAQESEINKLSTILREFASLNADSALPRMILMETLSARSEWPLWSQGIDAVPAQTKEIMDILSAHAAAADISALKKNLLDIAREVALAFHEGGDQRISADEQVALDDLQSALGL